MAKLVNSKSRFLSLLRYANHRDKTYLVIGSIFAAGAGVISPINVLIFRDVVNNFTSDAFSYVGTRTSVGYFVVIGFVMLAATFMQAFLLSVGASRLRRRLHYLCFESLLQKDPSWYENRSAADIGTVIENQVKLVEMGVGLKLGEFIQNTCGLLAGVIVAFTEGWKLSLVASALLPFVLLFFGMFGFIVNRLLLVEKLAYSEAAVTSMEAFKFVRTVYGFGTEKEEVKRYSSQLRNPEIAGIQRSVIVSSSEDCVLH
ncbi:unnamed protein product [Echinostoma caproni]|uniref:ABC transmembrane type-1 domain-containing protein n=1 Tax=Echinostoma caproni TaxID=27848 RepID=A0A183ARZ1_9TREM|nr:unnamed protein product [Echinostoma caproni]